MLETGACVALIQYQRTAGAPAGRTPVLIVHLPQQLSDRSHFSLKSRCDEYPRSYMMLIITLVQDQLCARRRSKCVVFRLQGEKQPLLQDALVFVAGGQVERSVDGLRATIMRSGGSVYKLNKTHSSVGTNQPKHIQDSLLLSFLFLLSPICLIPPLAQLIQTKHDALLYHSSA